jgi:hypothetical protein
MTDNMPSVAATVYKSRSVYGTDVVAAQQFKARPKDWLYNDGALRALAASGKTSLTPGDMQQYFKPGMVVLEINDGKTKYEEMQCIIGPSYMTIPLPATTQSFFSVNAADNPLFFTDMMRSPRAPPGAPPKRVQRLFVPRVVLHCEVTNTGSGGPDHGEQLACTRARLSLPNVYSAVYLNNPVEINHGEEIVMFVPLTENDRQAFVEHWKARWGDPPVGMRWCAYPMNHIINVLHGRTGENQEDIRRFLCSLVLGRAFYKVSPFAPSATVTQSH